MIMGSTTSNTIQICPWYRSASHTNNTISNLPTWLQQQQLNTDLKITLPSGNNPIAGLQQEHNGTEERSHGAARGDNNT
jgi:hypothetical protein